MEAEFIEQLPKNDTNQLKYDSFIFKSDLIYSPRPSKIDLGDVEKMFRVLQGSFKFIFTVKHTKII